MLVFLYSVSGPFPHFRCQRAQNAAAGLHDSQLQCNGLHKTCRAHVSVFAWCGRPAAGPFPALWFDGRTLGSLLPHLQTRTVIFGGLTAERRQSPVTGRDSPPPTESPPPPTVGAKADGASSRTATGHSRSRRGQGSVREKRGGARPLLQSLFSWTSLPGGSV